MTTNIVVLGAGIGGMPMAYELKEMLGRKAEITVVSDKASFEFTPSNPWVGVGWRKPGDIKLDLKTTLARHRIKFVHNAATRVVPGENRLDLADGSSLPYDYLVIATGPELAFDEVPGLGPHGGYTQSVCSTDHATTANEAWETFCKNPGPIIVGAVQGASCYGPAYEHAMIMDTDLRKRRIRDKVPMTFVTAEPYVGHLGLGGVGDTKGLLESEMRNRHIKWITNAKVERVEAGRMVVNELNEDASLKKTHELPFAYSMMLPAFRGIPAVRGVEGLVNPRGFILVDKHQRNPTHKNIFSVGVCIAIPPLEATPVPVGVPKTGFMIETMVTAATHNIQEILEGKEPTHEGTWNAFCLADFGDSGVVFIAQPQNPPRNINWSAKGYWVHLGKLAFEKYFIRKMRIGKSEPFYEKHAMKLINLRKTKSSAA